MKINREKLIAQMSKVASVANFKDAKGIIKFILNQQEENKYSLKLFASDGVNSVFTNMPNIECADVNVGEYLIDANKVNNYLKNLGAFEVEDIEIQLSSEKMLITTGKAKFEFPVEPIGNYPSMPDVDISKLEGKKHIINCDSALFLKKIQNVTKTIYQNGDRPIMQYANVLATQDSLTFTSTDGVRLSRLSMQAEVLDFDTQEPIQEPIQINLNSVILARLITPADGVDVSIIASDELIYVLDAESAITIKTIKGEYPDLSKLFPTVDFASGQVPFKSIWEVAGKDLNNALSLIKAVVSNEKEKRIKMIITPDESKIKSEKSRDEGSIVLDGLLTGEGIDINFDVMKLDVLSNGIEKLRICFTDAKKPVLIYDGSEDSNFTTTFLVMPTN